MVITAGGRMSLLAMALPVLSIALSAWPVGASEDCLWFVDRNGTWHSGFSCPLFTFCCGSCQRRLCCVDAFRMITEREQRSCTFFRFSPTTVAGIASSMLLFVGIIASMVCCFLCSCCYLYQRRQHLGRTPYDAQHIPMATYPVEPLYDAYGKPVGLGHPEYPAPGMGHPDYPGPGMGHPDYPAPGMGHPDYPAPGMGHPDYPAPGYPAPGYPMAPHYPGMAQPYPMMHPGPYPPYPMVAEPRYSQGEPPPYSPPQYTSR